ncbi:MAG: hypothetical protein MUE36_03335 [Acidimicrobiales bacterium]|nr:hypothetical protein [Acidimicrobiales bacterium]
MTAPEVAAFAPGRVNLMGDHTDYAGGLALPMAVDLGTTVRGFRTGTRIELASSDRPEPVDLPLVVDDPTGVEPEWGRYVAGVVAEVAPATGIVGTVHSTLPVGAGLSSSAALELSVALAIGFDGPAMALARLGRRAEHRASGVPCGLMDQLASACGVAGHALLVDFTTETFVPVAVPDDLEVIVVHSGQPRALSGSAYAERRASVEAAAAEVGPLAEVGGPDVAALTDPTLRRRARHVVTENERTRAMADALTNDDAGAIGAVMSASHRSLRDDFEVSTDALDRAVDALARTPGVLGARLTGAGFGGCVVGLARRGAVTDPDSITGRGWIVRPSGGAHRLDR